MKICFFNSSKSWGGGEKWHLDHALALQKDGHAVVVVSAHDGELFRRASSNNIRTRAVNIKNLSSLNPIKAGLVYSFFKTEQFDVLVMNFSKDLKIAAPLAKLAGIKKIIYRRGSDIPVKNSFSNRFLFGKCVTHILANSEKTKESILQKNPSLFPADKITVIYNGIQTSNYLYKPLENDIPVIGNIGRMVHQKRQDILIDVARILKVRGVKCTFRIGGDGILMKALKEKAIQEDLTNYIEFNGFVEDSNDFMRHIDIFALSSEWEGFGYVLAEAMLARKPIVAFNISSNPELIIEDYNGNLITWGDHEAFANAIEKLVQNPQKREIYGKNGFSLVCEKFDFNTNKERVIDFLLH